MCPQCAAVATPPARRGQRWVASHRLGVYPIGALSISFHEQMAADCIIGRRASATTDWGMAKGVLRINGRPRDVRAKLRRGLACPAGCRAERLPEVIIVSPYAGQLFHFLEELFEYFQVLDRENQRDLDHIPKFLLASSGVYFEELMSAARQWLRASALRDKDFFLEALNRRVFRAVAYQAAVRKGRGHDADYVPVAGGSYLILSRSGAPEDRARICELLRGRGYDISVESRFLESEYDKSLLNATISAFSQVYAAGPEGLVDVRCGDLISHGVALPAGFTPQPLADAPSEIWEKMRAVGEAFVAVAKAKGVYSPGATFEQKFMAGIKSFVEKIPNHLPSSTQWLIDRLSDTDQPWRGGDLFPTEAHIIRPMIRAARSCRELAAVALFEDLERRILESYKRVVELREDYGPILDKAAGGRRLCAMENAVLEYWTRRDLPHGLGNEGLKDAYRACAAALAAMPSISKTAVWRHYLPMALHLVKRARARRKAGAFVIGVNGLPGVGKTTTAGILHELLPRLCPGKRCVKLSIDDFYFTGEERKRLGLGWAVGAHDMSFAGVLARLKASTAGSRVEVPRFDKRIRDRVAPELVCGKIDFIVLEGFGVGLRSRGYQAFSKHIDYLVSLGTSVAQSQRWRREAGWNQRRTVLGEDRAAFDREFDALWSGVKDQFDWVMAEVDARADLLVSVGPSHLIESCAAQA